MAISLRKPLERRRIPNSMQLDRMYATGVVLCPAIWTHDQAPTLCRPSLADANNFDDELHLSLLSGYTVRGMQSYHECV
jgi:hypothetical protein